MARVFGMIFAAAIATMQLVATEASAQVTFTNRWKPDQKLNVEAGPPASTPAAADWLSAAWDIERTDDPKAFRIRNAWNGTCLDVQNGKLIARKVNPKVRSAMWHILDVAGAAGYVRLQHADTGSYLNVESGALTLGTADPSWTSAMWKVDRYAAKR